MPGLSSTAYASEVFQEETVIEKNGVRYVIAPGVPLDIDLEGLGENKTVIELNGSNSQVMDEQGNIMPQPFSTANLAAQSIANGKIAIWGYYYVVGGQVISFTVKCATSEMMQVSIMKRKSGTTNSYEAWSKSAFDAEKIKNTTYVITAPESNDYKFFVTNLSAGTISVSGTLEY